MTALLYVCVDCDEVLERDRNGLFCPKCYPAQRAATFRAVAEEHVAKASTRVELQLPGENT